jgi:alkylation response protein AidB-like acyl-CoA dehydrogenase
MTSSSATRTSSATGPEQRAAALANRAAALERARALAPSLMARAARTEADRRIPDETIGELLDSGLFGLAVPRIFGGSELGFESLVEVTAELACACGSTGWVFGVLAGHAWLLTLFPPEAQREVFSDPRALTATVFRLGGKVTEVEGGYHLVGGEGRFCSGVDHAKWVMVANAVIRTHGAPEPRFFIVPSDAVEIVDDWFTAGMRGTGSRSIRIADTFIPSHRSVLIDDMMRGTSPGGAFHNTALYRTPFQDVAAFTIGGAPLGMARAAVRTLADLLKVRVSNLDDQQIAEHSVALARLAEAACDIDSTFLLVMSDAARIDAAQPISPLERVRIMRNWSYAVQKSRHAVNRLFETTGGSGIYDSSDMQRIWRDINSAAQHAGFVWDTAMMNFGRVAAGLQPIAFAVKRKT